MPVKSTTSETTRGTIVVPHEIRVVLRRLTIPRPYQENITPKDGVKPVNSKPVIISKDSFYTILASNDRKTRVNYAVTFRQKISTKHEKHFSHFELEDTQT